MHLNLLLLPAVKEAWVNQQSLLILAVSLARLGKKVGLIDADIYGFSVPDMMGITQRPVVEGEKIIPVDRFGVKVISMGFFVEDNSPVILARTYAWKNS